MKKMILLVLFFALAAPGAFSQSKPSVKAQSVAEFHDIKLGKPLEGQLAECILEHGSEYALNGFPVKDSQRCYMHTTGFGPDSVDDEEHRGFVVRQVWEDSQVYDADVTLLQVVDGNVEGVTLEWVNVGVAAEKFDSLRKKYGLPSCEKIPMRTGIGLPITREVCAWHRSWGIITWENFSKTYTDEMNVKAFTPTLTKAIAAAKARHLKKKEF